MSSLNQAEEQADNFKQLGNKQFASGNFKDAEAFYSKGLDVLESQSCVPAKTLCVLHNNRSNARYNLGDFEASLEDATVALEMDPSFSKAYHRKGMALHALERKDEAEQCYRLGMENSPEQADWLEKHLAKLSSVKRPVARRKKKPGNIQSGFLRAPKQSIYPEHDADTPEKREEQRAKRMLESIKQDVLKHDESSALIDGVFKKLLDPVEFRQMIYKSDKIPDDPALPKSFQELLQNETFAKELVRLIPRAQKKAITVLENVKRKAAVNGEFMDPTIEASLRPQVLNEAIARELVDLVHSANRRQQVEITNSLASVASTSAAEASWDQLTAATIFQLTDDSVRFAFQDGYLDDGDGDWLELLLEDARRVEQTEKFVTVGDMKHASMVWIPLSTCEEEYPAFFEVGTRLSALPHELNSKAGLKLSENLTKSILFVAFQGEGGGYDKRIDGGFGAGDSGIQVSCTYTFTESWDFEKDGGQLQLSVPEIGADPTNMNPTHDRLVLYRSRTVANEIVPIKGVADSKRRYSLSLYLNGPAKDNVW